MTWKPMTTDEAREVLSSDPPESAQAIESWSDRYAEAWMVSSGVLSPERIKAAMEHLTGHRLD